MEFLFQNGVMSFGFNQNMKTAEAAKYDEILNFKMLSYQAGDVQPIQLSVQLDL